MVSDIQLIDPIASLTIVADRTSFIDLKRAIKRNNGGKPTSEIVDIMLTSIYFPALKQAAPTMELMPSDQETLTTTYEIKSNPYAPKVSE